MSRNRWCIVSDVGESETVFYKTRLYWCNGVRKDDWGNVREYAKVFPTKKEAENYLLIVLAGAFECLVPVNIRVIKLTDRWL